MFLKPPSDSATKVLDELFASRDFLELDPYNPHLRLDINKRKRLKEGLEPLFKKAFDSVKKELFPIYCDMINGLINADKIAKEKLKIFQEKIPSYKILYPIMRGESHTTFFFRTLYVFYHLGMNQDFIRGYQLVGSELGQAARKNFFVELFMIDFCDRRFGHPGNIVLHAGELLEATVKEMPHQVHLSAHLGLDQQRKKVVLISHGVAATDAELDELKKLDICVEVCLTSNELILGIPPEKHIIHRLLKKRIPFTLSTDDPQHFNITLSTELVNALMNYGLDYFDIKNCFRNKFHYSADLGGFSLYQEDPLNPGRLKLISPFDRADTFENPVDLSPFSDKADQAYRWEKQTAEYEREFFNNTPDLIHDFLRANSNVETISKVLGEGMTSSEIVALKTQAEVGLRAYEIEAAEIEKLEASYMDLLDQEEEIEAERQALLAKQKLFQAEREEAIRQIEEGEKLLQEGLAMEEAAKKAFAEAIENLIKEGEFVPMILNADGVFVPMK